MWRLRSSYVAAVCRCVAAVWRLCGCSHVGRVVAPRRPSSRVRLIGAVGVGAGLRVPRLAVVVAIGGEGRRLRVHLRALHPDHTSHQTTLHTRPHRNARCEE
eukprot:698796-Prymnesium_polylepis.1